MTAPARPRRLAQQLAGTLLAIAQGGAARAQDVSTAVFHAPSGEKVLTRILRRPLHDGKEVVTARSYAVRFVPVRDGYRLEGREIDVRVDAPQRLAVLADFERGHRDDGMFPIRLDAHGRIIGYSHGTTPPRPSALAAGAGPQAGQLLENTALKPDERAQAARQIDTLIGQITAWPSDLFQSQSVDRSTRHATVLPDGSSGRVTMRIVSSGDGRVMRRFERVVTTQAGGEARTSSETWLLHDKEP